MFGTKGKNKMNKILTIVFNIVISLLSAYLYFKNPEVWLYMFISGFIVGVVFMFLAVLYFMEKMND